jgi:guanosine-3',5'-bis(diphosphate) 3'-pyrophosphohydrolase
MDFVNEFKLNLFNDEIYVFTPKGELRVLPIGSTVLDFAYDIHTKVGDTCIGAKVNNKLMPLSYQLQSGDQLEIITSSKQRPNEEWLRMAITARAKQKIKSTLNEERKQIADDGKEILIRKFKQQNIRFASENITFLEKAFHLPSATELYFRIAKGKIDLARLREFDNENGLLVFKKKEVDVKRVRKKESIQASIDKKSDTLIIGEDFKNIQYTLAKCCSPIPGDNVFGFITINDGIKVHRNNCPNAEHLMSKMAYRCIAARWKTQELIEREVTVKIFGFDRMGIVNRLTEIISNQHNVNMKSISFETEDGLFEGRVRVMVYDTEHLDQLMRKFEQVEGVQRVVRWDDENNEPEELGLEEQD